MLNWTNFTLKDKEYYILCQLNENNVKTLLYDGNESWYEEQTLEAILARVKEENKRIKYDEATIKETLQNAKPTEANWLANDDSDKDDECEPVERLKLKYLVKSLTFNFTWHFRKQSEHDFQKFILYPLFRIVQGLAQQNKELREIIRKKDVEIKQYKREFGVIKIVTVSTQIFNAAEFDGRFAETTELTRCIMQISDLLKAQYSQMKTPLRAKTADKRGDSLADKDKDDLKLTPRARRRKIIAEKQRVIAEKVQAINKPFAYESSQSQVSNRSSSEKELASTSKRQLRSPQKCELRVENDLDEMPTKRNRTEMPSSGKSTAKIVKRNLNAGIEYDDSSDEEDNKNVSIKQHELSERTSNLSPSTRGRASLTSTEPKSTEKPAKPKADIFEFNESSDDASKRSPKKQLSQAIKQTQAAESKRNNNDAKEAIDIINPKPSTSSSMTKRPTRKVAGIVYDDSSESQTEGYSPKKCNSPLLGSPNKNSNSNVNLSPEQLSADVQKLIDECKALEKRRLEDLKHK